MNTEIPHGQIWGDWLAGADQDLTDKYRTRAWKPTAKDREASYILYNELQSRISTQHLRYREGDEISALTSVYSLFPKTRELIERSGTSATHFADITNFMLNKKIRPFTSYWHRQKENGGFSQQDNRRLFRQHLRKINKDLENLARIMKSLTENAQKVYEPNQESTVNKHLFFDDQPLNPSSFIGPNPSDFFEIEIKRIQDRRNNAYSKGSDERKFGGLGLSADKKNGLGLVGLSLSGGGIRSATFCLGVVQGLAEHGVLKDIDYLSTVSGGGYLGAFLSSRLNPIDGDNGLSIEELLTTHANRTGDSKAVRHLRNNSKYLLSKNWRDRLKTMAKVGALPFQSKKTLHELYRDRLANCYLYEKDMIKMSQLSAPGSSAPYHLVNTTVNLPGSKSEELRGRRSDFFVITPDYAGSSTTGYCAITDLEELDQNLTLASAMAVSGAAISSNLGTNKITAARALATLNLSLGYWIPNPSKVKEGRKLRRSLLRRWYDRTKDWWGTMDEYDPYVNLSDGGHIENLGLYELLRRRCKFIIAVDGECDRGRTCRALINAERMAAIDMGVKINIDIRDLEIDSNQLSQCHFALGTIDYGAEDNYSRKEKGVLLYIKSSLTGNEPNYVREYRARNKWFPHETTADQFFDEDQFEAYRALGEHVANDLFGPDVVRKDHLLKENTRFRTRCWLNALCQEFLSPEGQGDHMHNDVQHVDDFNTS